MRHTIFILSMILIGLGVSSMNAAAQERPPAPTHRDLVYADVSERSLLDLYLPEGDGPFPLIVWVHGGAWRFGSKADCFPVRMGLVEHAYAVACINYRLTGEAIFPAQIEDVKAAVRWLRAQADTYSLDPDRFGVWGNSAGGHLVALLGTSGDVDAFDTGDHLEFSSKVQAVVDYYGPTDLTQFVITPGYEDHAAADSPESRLLGGLVLDNLDRAARANPITYVSPDDPPFLIVHGTADPVVPFNQSQLLYDALTEADLEAELISLPEAGHGGPQFADAALIAQVIAFFDAHLKDELAANASSS